ncbi:MAG TPA: DUF4097 family beta strand repeat-containing protein [Terriglobia bacterium]|nr:DUF4097 family beta strand repeat-containing protein [Terriglobia bacterium]
MRLKVWLGMGFMAAALPLQAGPVPAARTSGDKYVTRGAITHQGRAWVQFLTCQAPAREGGRLILRADSGSVVVRSDSAAQVGCIVRLAVYGTDEAVAKEVLSRYQLSVRNLGAAGVYIGGRFPYERRHNLSLDAGFGIHAPERYNLDIETQGGGIDVAKLDGDLRASTAGGDIRTGDVTGLVWVKTAGGDINLGNIGQRVDAETAGGHIRVGDVKGDASLTTSGGDIVAGRLEGSLRAETAGGSIYLRAASGPVMAQTAGGQIQLGECGNTVDATTAAGSIRLDGARGMVRAQTAGGSLDLLQLQGAVRAETAAGRIMAQLAASRDSFAASELESTVGDVMVYIPMDLPMNIDAHIDESAGHKIFSDFPLNVQGMAQGFGSGNVRARGALLGGGQLLRLHTTMGNIEIKKLDQKALNQFKEYEKTFLQRWQVQWNEHGVVVQPAPADDDDNHQ